ncbi:MAG: DUF2892 domain-containing protein [Candidatus Woesearchaeota archaeon]|jgi:hypothetical protein|nr:DUF2892 domain-containing protein [Candidatus Woesearchaeota archaeon]
MEIENKINIIAGSFIFISTLLSIIHNPNWIYVTMFVGLNLFQFGFTNFCPLKIILKKLEKI